MGMVVMILHHITLVYPLPGTMTIDYRATYVYGIGNGRAPLIVLLWATLIPSSEYVYNARKD